MTQGKKYGFRLIGQTMNCPIVFSIDNHNLLMIASDGRPFEPYEVSDVKTWFLPIIDFHFCLSAQWHSLCLLSFFFQVESLVIQGGERYDFVLNANYNALSNHWLRITGLGDCSNSKTHQEAILRYQGAAEVDPPGKTTYEDNSRQGKVQKQT